MINATELSQFTVTIYLICVRYMKHRMQIMQECWKYDLMTNNKRLQRHQKLTVVFVIHIPTAVHLSDNLIPGRCQLEIEQYRTIVKKSKKVTKTCISGKNTCMQTLLTGASFINDSVLQRKSHVSHPLLTSRILF